MEFSNSTGKKAIIYVYEQSSTFNIDHKWTKELEGNQLGIFSPPDKKALYKAWVKVIYGIFNEKIHWIENISGDQKILIDPIPGKEEFDLLVKVPFKPDNTKRSVEEMSAPHEHMKFGIGKADITYFETEGLKMARLTGWGKDQPVKGIEQRLYARSFIIEGTNGKRVVYVVADIWGISNELRKAVIRKLNNPKYAMENVMICATHTHSAPGGYMGWSLYDRACGGWNEKCFDRIVEGIVNSIHDAETDFCDGKIYTNWADLDCGRNRSPKAYYNNTAEERKGYGSETDREMLLLKFVRVKSENGVNKEIPWGSLNWFAIHPTNRGQENLMINGDNKGWASRLMEEDDSFTQSDTTADTAIYDIKTLNPRSGFIAAFANSNCGDVTGNPKADSSQRTQEEEIANMKSIGLKQYEHAKELFNGLTKELKGAIEYRHMETDMTNVSLDGGKRTYRGALGLSMFAGSTEDGVAGTGLREGIVEKAWDENQVQVLERVMQGYLIQAFTTFTWVDMIGFNPIISGSIKAVVNVGAKPLTELSWEEKEGHLPKPITVLAGKAMHEGIKQLTPDVLPFQFFQIDDLLIAGIPAELTTMAGRRLRNRLSEKLPGVKKIVLACYANEYSQYVTTREEYDKQHYEGASVLFGPHTLDAYIKLFDQLTGKPANARRNSAEAMREQAA